MQRDGALTLCGDAMNGETFLTRLVDQVLGDA